MDMNFLRSNLSTITHIVFCGNARALTDLCDINQVWTSGWRRLRAHTDAEFREAVEEANELHATGDLFARQIEPEPAPVDPAMPDAPPEPELIGMPPALASAPPMSSLERCIALRLVYDHAES